MIWMIKCQCREAILMELRGVWSLEAWASPPGSQQGPGTPILLEWGSWPSQLFTGSDDHSDSQRARNLCTGLSKAGMSFSYQLANRLQRLIWSRQRSEWVPPILNSNSPID